MSRGGTIPIAAGGIPLERRHDILVECFAQIISVSWTGLVVGRVGADAGMQETGFCFC